MKNTSVLQLPNENLLRVKKKGIKYQKIRVKLYMKYYTKRINCWIVNYVTGKRIRITSYNKRCFLSHLEAKFFISFNFSGYG